MFSLRVWHQFLGHSSDATAPFSADKFRGHHTHLLHPALSRSGHFSWKTVACCRPPPDEGRGVSERHLGDAPSASSRAP